MNRYERAVVRRIVEVRSTMLEAIHANNVNQYDSDIRVMRHTIDEMLDLLVEFNRVTEDATERKITKG